jgi:hypothetical protein
MDKENMKGRFWVFWMRKTIRKVTMVVLVKGRYRSAGHSCGPFGFTSTDS